MVGTIENKDTLFSCLCAHPQLLNIPQFKILVSAPYFQPVIEDYRDMFEKYGPVVSMHIGKYENGGFQGTGYVQYRYACDLATAKKARWQVGDRVMRIADSTKELAVEKLDGVISETGYGPRCSLSGDELVMRAPGPDNRFNKPNFGQPRRRG